MNPAVGPGPVGRQVRLRPPVEADLRRLYEWYRDPELVAPFDRYSEESFEEFAESTRRAPGDPASLAPRFLVEPTADPRPVGCVGYYRSHPVLDLVEVWYLIADRTARGHGYGAEAVGLLVGELFRTQAVERVGASTDTENAASTRLLEGLGLRREGTVRSGLFHHGRWHDVYVYGITRAEWAARSARAPG